MTEAMQKLLQQKQSLIAQGEQASAAKDFETLKTVSESLKTVNGQIADLTAFEEAKKASEGTEINVSHIGESDKKRLPFRSFGEQLAAIAKFRKNGVFDNRLNAVNELMGQNETNGADGGFAVQQDFAGAIFDTIRKRSDILSRVSMFDVSAPSNSARWYTPKDGADETFGVRMNWAAEGKTAAESKIGLVEAKIDLEKMMGFAYASDEMLQDSSLINTLLSPAFEAGAENLLVAAIINGDGVGKPLGILKSKSLVKIEKESAQTEKIVPKNIVKMYTSMPAKMRQKAVWLAHPDMAAEFPFMKFEIGQGGVPVFLPPTAFAGSPNSSLYGIPVVEDDNCSEVGKTGDLMLVDLSKYMVFKKGTVKQDVSMHVEFLTDQMCYRYVFRVNGQPIRNTTYKIKNSDTPRSPFIALADRK